jgi:excinuclease ABC subunit C
MATGQLWLFPPARPLAERFGEDFFRRLPPRPGVYLMCGAPEGVLYVGKAKNLRRRLSSYRVANPERLPRRIIRLLQRVTRIEYDECADEAAARWREEMLICVLSPRFNRAGKVWPQR